MIHVQWLISLQALLYGMCVLIGANMPAKCEQCAFVLVSHPAVGSLTNLAESLEKHSCFDDWLLACLSVAFNSTGSSGT